MKKLSIMEVCPRDGWQNIPEFIPTELKLDFIREMLAAGITNMQIGSFVHPKVVPQMSETGKIASIIMKEYPDVRFDALIPNLKGAVLASDVGLKSVSYVISVSESHNKANIGRTHEQSFHELGLIIESYPDLGVTLSLATAFGCPFEGSVELKTVLGFVEKGLSAGLNRVELADTIGIGNPRQVALVFSEVKKKYPNIVLSAHMHDTRNNGIINSWTAAENGADIMHTSLGGLGGCPFAPGASGNTSTEDLVWLLNESGIDTGIDFDSIKRAAKRMHGTISGNYSGHQINIKDDTDKNNCLENAPEKK
jgi:hydroxymethylglutaryl-CoA lyase